MNLKLLENAFYEVHSQKNKENFVHENVHRLIWYVYEIIVRELRNNLDPFCILIVVSALTLNIVDTAIDNDEFCCKKKLACLY